jgi:hypothetical protein
LGKYFTENVFASTGIEAPEVEYFTVQEHNALTQKTIKNALKKKTFIKISVQKIL